MTINISGVVYYQTAEACRQAGLSKNTFLRWIREGVIADVGQRDRRGWRLFTEKDLEILKSEANKTSYIKGGNNNGYS
jgi:predicted site-specific integrase-resolvase